MAITDEYGNKLPQPKTNKKQKSQQEREIAAIRARKHQGIGCRCPECGYRIRNREHFNETHHLRK